MVGSEYDTNSMKNVVTHCFHEHENEFYVLQCSSQSPDLNPVEHLWDVEEYDIHSMKVHLKNVPELCDEIKTTLARFSKEWFQHLV